MLATLSHDCDIKRTCEVMIINYTYVIVKGSPRWNGKCSVQLFWEDQSSLVSPEEAELHLMHQLEN